MLWVYGYTIGQEWQLGAPEVYSVQIHTFHLSNGVDLTNAKGQERQCTPEACNIRSRIDGISHGM